METNNIRDIYVMLLKHKYFIYSANRYETMKYTIGIMVELHEDYGGMGRMTIKLEGVSD